MVDWVKPKPQSKLFYTEGWKQLTGKCVYDDRRGDHPVIPPFPQYVARDVFETDLFDQYLQA